ncbi:ATP-binding protein [Dehalobacterium formicoaceticum]|uniref:ATP-binding protein n=1 Tax=Dehalobacterium formicoaceticum TaxID=51515 RepID=A0ABT1Y7V5_9FIRM|nr:ATP-binding protein [Dehalobacterium formicoaceticum]MCR6546966.1 ATP-binding protein [Dehalobacterium formicoaceticum]
MKNRDLYLIQLIQYRDKPLIKVITGLRRCGKSTLLSLFENYLIENGVVKDHIIRMNFESFEFDEITSYKELHAYIKERLINNRDKHYILLDEVQQVSSWEKVVNSFLVDANVDIYITGSNAYLLSSELSTLLSGRYVEIKMQPLSFKEYLDFTENDKICNLQEKFNQYLKYGGLPTVVDLMDNPDTIGPFLEGIYNTVLIKDVIKRNGVRDAALLESILKFIAANIGSIVSTKKISDYLTSSGRKTTSDTIDNYLRMLENAFIIYKANRYDLKGKMFLKTLEKYYIVDMGIRNQLAGLRNTDYGHILENLVYLELLRRGYDVTIGKVGKLEVDFVATKADEKIYYQVSATILDEKTRERELRPLESISDNYPKYILTMDQTVFNDYSGIKVKNIIDFLLE